MDAFNAATGKSSYFMHKNIGLGILCMKDMIFNEEMCSSSQVVSAVESSEGYGNFYRNFRCGNFF